MCEYSSNDKKILTSVIRYATQKKMKEKYTNRKKDHIDNSSDENDSHECLAYFFYNNSIIL